MSTNKHASFRYRTLNQCFCNRGRRKWTLDELTEAVSRQLQEDFGVDLLVSKRTIQGDINIMRSGRPRGFDAPIICKRGLYFYDDPNFSIEKIGLGRDELNLLHDAVGLLRQLPGMPQLPALEMLLKRVEGNTHLSNLSPALIHFEINSSVQGLEWLGQIYRAIAEQQVLSFHYHPFTEEPLDILLHSYLLKEWNNRWYVFGRNERDQLWNLALDRIKYISSLDNIIYRENDLFDPATWFDDIVGVSKPENAHAVDVEFEVSYLSSRYLETRPIHRSQRLVHLASGRYIFTLKVILNQELVNELLRYGNDLQVLKPLVLQERMEKRLGLSS